MTKTEETPATKKSAKERTQETLAAAKPAAKSVPAPAPKSGKPAPTPKAPASKPAPEPKSKPAKAARTIIPADAKLTALFKDNPARAGTVAWKVRELYRRCGTVGAWREEVSAKDLDAGYLQNDIRRGLIKVG